MFFYITVSILGKLDFDSISIKFSIKKFSSTQWLSPKSSFEDICQTSRTLFFDLLKAFLKLVI